MIGSDQSPNSLFTAFLSSLTPASRDARVSPYSKLQVTFAFLNCGMTLVAQFGIPIPQYGRFWAYRPIRDPSPEVEIGVAYLEENPSTVLNRFLGVVRASFPSGSPRPAAPGSLPEGGQAPRGSGPPQARTRERRPQPRVSEEAKHAGGTHPALGAGGSKSGARGTGGARPDRARLGRTGEETDGAR